MNKKIMLLCFITSIAFWLFCKVDEEELAYQAMRRTRSCELEGLAGKQPQSLCDLAYRLSQALVDSTAYENAALFYGPPGTGKTTLATAIAKKADAKLIKVFASEIVTKMQGGGAERIKKLFSTIQSHLDNNEKVLLFIDEVDCISRERTVHKNEDHMNALMELNIKVTEYAHESRLVIIVATNKKEFIDSALLSRFKQIEIPLPNYQACIAIFTHHLNKHPHELGEAVPHFARRAVHAHMSCRDIEKIVTEAYWQSKTAGATKVLRAAVEDEIENMEQKKASELEKQKKEQEDEKLRKEMLELQYYQTLKQTNQS